ncbi:MAG: Fe-S protein assembly co-chaperone HscB, partial [Alphaproteobacteria bacterium]|nr:Fe-S protein assembly co-chaperone HscB [Alphaproteobacteria bacterium]
MDRQHNLQQSIDINRAYDTLKNPLSRAQHLLHLQGITVGAERDTVKPDPGMLAECMEWREALEEAEDRGAVEQLYRKAFQARETCLANLEHACNEAQWETAAQAALKLSYMEKLLDDIQRKAHLP